MPAAVKVLTYSGHALALCCRYKREAGCEALITRDKDDKRVAAMRYTVKLVVISPQVWSVGEFSYVNVRVRCDVNSHTSSGVVVNFYLWER